MMEKSKSSSVNVGNGFNNVNDLTKNQISELNSNFSGPYEKLGSVREVDGSGSYSKPIKLG